MSLITMASFQNEARCNVFIEPHDAWALKVIDVARKRACEPERLCQVMIPLEYVERGSVAFVG